MTPTDFKPGDEVMLRPDTPLDRAAGCFEHDKTYRVRSLWPTNNYAMFDNEVAWSLDFFVHAGGPW